MTESGQLRLPSCWAAEPVKSSVSSSPATVAVSVEPRSPSRASSTSSAWRVPSGERGEAGAHAPLGVVDRLGHRGLQAAAGVQLAQPLDARAVGGELGAQVGAALARAGASARRAPRSPPRRAAAARSRRPRRRAWSSRRASSRASGRRRRRGGRGWRRSRAASPSAAKAGRDHRDVGQVGAAAVGVVEHPGRRRARASSPTTASTAAGIAPRCTGMCSACITIRPAGVEQRAGRVAALLDVRASARRGSARRPSPRRPRAGRRRRRAG